MPFFRTCRKDDDGGFTRVPQSSLLEPNYDNYYASEICACCYRNLKWIQMPCVRSRRRPRRLRPRRSSACLRMPPSVPNSCERLGTLHVYIGADFIDISLRMTLSPTPEPFAGAAPLFPPPLPQLRVSSQPPRRQTLRSQTDQAPLSPHSNP